MENNTTPAEMPETNPEVKPENLSINLNWVKKINWKYLIVAIVIVAIGALAFYYKSVFVAATVDGHIITRLSVVKKLEKQTGSSTLDALISNQLINDAAKKQNISLSTADVNTQIDKIKTQVESQGGTMDEALAQAGMTMDDLKIQVTTEMLLEKLLGDKVAVTDDEINKYITDNKVTIPAGQDATIKAQIKDQLMQGKVSSNASAYIADLKTKAHIKTYVNY